MTKPVTWSHSTLDKFETCPRQYWHLKVAKDVVEPPSEALTWGNKVHKALELYVKDGAALPETIIQFQPMADQIRSRPGTIRTEQQLAVDRNYQPSNWFKGAWGRAIMDVSVETPKGDKMFVGDWKTGKPKPDSKQLQISAAFAFAHYPRVQSVTTAFLWLATGGITAERYERGQVPEIWQDILPRVQRLELAHQQQKFPPKPSGLCRKWCCVPRHLCEHAGT